MKFLLLLSLLCSVSLYGKENLQISKYFKLKDATKSATAQRYKINNLPKSNTNVIYAAKRLDKVKEILKKDIYITSWYRGDLLNKKVKGVKNSQHKDGLAIDFKINGSAKTIKSKLDKANISYDQLIYYRKQNRVHISFNKNISKERNQYILR
ncbi:D-Ala-D-Ala carboxypeptidase family metallohydrolase [Cetobacterium sp.]|uniref:D-Ala-D-Ala carboxypeptidase family metallohydrolase n=1 Tax=Cetobacterium sp. TaxID=2071632 RepID=UPI0025DD443D|nr:D-Ala-D-Ala carboxypeptidase family metallohydrolase [uncultured Cetobacterium sp.]